MTEPSASPLCVLGDDGAESSDRAWRWITAHPWRGWDIDVLTADADSSRMQWGEPVQPRPWSNPWQRDPSRVEAETVRFLTAAADPRALLAETRADLLVIGIKPHGRLTAVVTGSTTEWLLHHPPAPLAIIRRSEAVSRVLFCADGSAHADQALATFAALPLAGSTAVTVLSVDDGRTDVAAADRAAATLAGAVAEVSVRTASGRPTDTILEAIESTDADLVLLGTRGLTGWKRLRLGSTASAVVRSTTVDSLVACVDTDSAPA